jgi:WD40 repeat protein
MYVTGASLSRDGRRVLTWGVDGTAKLWEVSKPNDPLASFPHGQFGLGGVQGAALSRDESRLLTWGNSHKGGGSAKLWEVVKPDKLIDQFINDESGIVQGALFNRDESRVLIWTNDGTANLWEVGTNKRPIVFKHSNHIEQASFGPYEQRIVTRGEDTAKLWEVGVNDPLIIITHGKPVIDAVISKDKASLLSLSSDGDVRRTPLQARKYVPLASDVPDADLSLEVEVQTGTGLDPTGRVVALSPEEWRQRKQRLEKIIVR